MKKFLPTIFLKLPAESAWHIAWRKTRKLFFVLFGLELLILILSSFQSTQDFSSILTAITFIVYLLFFLYLSVIELSCGHIKHAFGLPIFLALSVGLASALLRIIWYFDTWTYYNLFLEPFFQMLWALVFGLICIIFYFIYKKISSIFAWQKNRIRHDLNIK